MEGNALTVSVEWLGRRAGHHWVGGLHNLREEGKAVQEGPGEQAGDQEGEHGLFPGFLT